MLPYGLKIAWFCLSLSGLISCWIVLIAFARAVSSYWGPLVYAIGCTILEVSFCIGLAWKMNPSLMPRAFCLTQVIAIAFSAYLLTGVCTAFSLATNFTVLKPKTWGQASSCALAWRNIYAVPIVLFPLAASAAHITVIIKLDAVQPTDDLHCDATNPTWARFLGYAGLPLLLCLPCFFLSLLSIFRVRNINKHINRSFRDEDSSLTALPPRRNRNDLFHSRVIPSPSPSSPPMSPGRAPIRPGFASPVLSARQFHLPFSPPPLDTRHDYYGSSTRSSTSDEPESPASTSFPTFSTGDGPIVGHKEPVDPAAIMNPEAFRHYELHDHTTEVEDWRDLRNRINTPDTSKSDNDKLSSLRWARHPEDIEEELRRSKSDFGFDFKGGERPQYEGDEGDEGFVIVGDPHDELRYTPRSRRTTAASSPSKRPRNLAPAIWRIILFQLLFTLVLGLASISTIIDIARHAPQPTPFGTQHVALLLAAWGPAIFFGHLPSVRQHLYHMFSWKSK